MGVARIYGLGIVRCDCHPGPIQVPGNVPNRLVGGQFHPWALPAQISSFLFQTLALDCRGLHWMTAKKIADGSCASRDILVSNKLGIHARPAAMFVKTANRFACDIFVEKDGERVNGKSIMGLMMLAAGPGSKVTVCAEGHDADAALAELETLMQRKFDED